MAIILIISTETVNADSLTPYLLNTLWRINLGPDETTTATPQERDAHTTSGALYYIPASNQSAKLVANPNGATVALPGVRPFYRLVNPNGSDHMDSTTLAEGTYHAEGPLGFVFMSPQQFPGLIPLSRAYDSQVGNYHSGDHALIFSGDSTHPAEQFSYYTNEGTVGYGYARYLSANTSLVSVSGGGVTINSNANTGGAVWEWWWHGTQFINDYDYGRQLSTTVTSGNSVLEEAGDQFGGPSVPVYARHPSPTLSIKTSGKYQSTLAIPVDWQPQNFIGGGAENPIIYPNAKIGKNLFLDWIGPDKVDHNWPLVEYESVYQGPTLSLAQVEAPTAYIGAQFDTYYQYNPITDTLTQFYPTPDVPIAYNLPANGPASLIIASSASHGLVAMGVYENSPNAGLCVYNNLGTDGGEYGSSFAKWGVNYDGALSNYWAFRTWIATDTVDNLKSYFRQLYLWGVTSRDGTHDNATNTYDPVFYLGVQPDLAKAFGATGYSQASVHWYAQGLPLEGRRGSPEFDPTYYLKLYPDLVNAFGLKGYQAGLNHFVSIGLPTEGRRGSLEFDVQYYLKTYPDLAAVFTGPTRYQDAANHWMLHGLPIEGRAGSADFNVQHYLARYPDLRAAFGATGYAAALTHWVTYGRAEGRNGR